MGWLIIFLGFLLLFLGAALLIRSSIQIVENWGLSKSLFSLTVVALIISLPEATINFMATLKGASGEVALKNAFASNVVNIGFILGLFLLFLPCNVTQEMKKEKMPQLFLVYLLVFFTMLGGKISRFEGAFLLAALLLFIFLQFSLFPKHSKPKNPPKNISLHVLGAVGACFLLIIGTKIIMHSDFHLPFFAFHSSFPQLAFAIVAAFRKEQTMMLGAIIGSNIFNPLLIIPFAAFVTPIHFSQKILLVDYLVMVFFSILLWVLMLLGKGRLSRLNGGILLLAYFSYVAYLYI